MCHCCKHFANITCLIPKSPIFSLLQVGNRFCDLHGARPDAECGRSRHMPLMSHLPRTTLADRGTCHPVGWHGSAATIKGQIHACVPPDPGVSRPVQACMRVWAAPRSGYIQKRWKQFWGQVSRLSRAYGEARGGGPRERDRDAEWGGKSTKMPADFKWNLQLIKWCLF